MMDLAEEDFAPLEEAIADTLVPSLFGVNSIGSEMRTISLLPVGDAGMGALDPT